MPTSDPYGTGTTLPAPVNPEVDPYGVLSKQILKSTIKNRRGPSATWLSVNPVLAEGEIGYETDTKRFKMGDGVTIWTSLSYFLPEPDIAAMIEEAVITAPPPPAALQDHIDSVEPHPVYDNGPSLFLLYQNAKV